MGHSLVMFQGQPSDHATTAGQFLQRTKGRIVFDNININTQLPRTNKLDLYNLYNPRAG